MGAGGVKCCLNFLSARSGSDEVIRYTFDKNDEGWVVAGGNSDRPDHDSEGGNLDGHIYSTSPRLRYWTAPSGLKGDFSDAYGGRLSFDLNTTVWHDTVALVELEGGGAKIVFNGEYPVRRDWTNFNILLDEKEDWIVEKSKRATESDIRKVLSNVTQLRIRAGFCGGKSTCGLDNVSLSYPGASLSQPEGARVASRFDNGDENWQVAGVKSGRSGVLDYTEDDGIPGGHIYSEEPGERYWIAPPKFKGDFSSAYGGSLEFYLNTTNCHNTHQLVILEGGGIQLYFDGRYPLRGYWTYYYVPLNVDEKWFNTATGSRATEKEMRTLLAALGQLKIRAGFAGNRTSSGLDNVVMRLSDDRLPKWDGSDLAYTFDSDTGGWSIAGSAFQRAGVIDHMVDGGNTGGYLSANSPGGSYWIAPGVVYGDLSAAYGGKLAFDLKSAVCHHVKHLVVLEGGGVQLSYDGKDKPRNWKNFTVNLDQSGRWINTATNSRAKKSEIRAALSALGSVKILAGYAGGHHENGLDNVVLKKAE